jgi:hypothetical protein
MSRIDVLVAVADTSAAVTITMHGYACPIGRSGFCAVARLTLDIVVMAEETAVDTPGNS